MHLRRYKFFLLAFCSLSGLLVGQLETAWWLFGNKCTVNFPYNQPPISFGTGTMLAGEGCASISDAAGNLLFYTNGMQVWNKLHVPMPNPLSGGGSSTQSSIILPGANSKYFIFTTDDFGTGPLCYSVVDMNLASGNGSVISTYTLIPDSITEGLTATRHCNGSDYWALAHTLGSNTFKSYRVTPFGVNTIPVLSNIGISYTLQGQFFTQFKFNSQGSKLVGATVPNIPNQFNTIELFDFNQTTGSVTSVFLLNTDSIYYYLGPEFSSDGTKLYAVKVHGDSALSGYKYITQWDLCAGSFSAIAASQTTVGACKGTVRTLQNALDGKIYFTSSQSQPTSLHTMGSINSPNLQGLSSNLTNTVLTLVSGYIMTGTLPNFMTSYFRQKPQFAPTSNSLSCGTLTFTPVLPCAGAGYTLSSMEWNFGDPGSGALNTSTVMSPVHTFSANGNFTVKLILHYPCFSDTGVQTISISSFPVLTVVSKTAVCKGESLIMQFSGATTYTLNTQALGQSSIQLQPTVTTVYTLSGTGSTGCSAKKVFTITVLPCTGISETGLSIGLKVYPNPNSGVFTFETPEACEIKIHNSLGLEVYRASVSEGTSLIDLSNESKGIYLLEWRGKSIRYQTKIILE
ncbi:MAG TPA: T9SS type A sorting domain-containing protein [Bacteroidia bacterium]|nr:T9SS type A sorting domain-containing protein [Bacteroidia bacterium]